MKRTGLGTWRTHAQLDESQLIKIENKEGLTRCKLALSASIQSLRTACSGISVNGIGCVPARNG
jgi:hypothetical protein